MIDWHDVSLLGIDVGFSKTAKSTGMAVYDRGHLVTLTCIGSSPENRADVLQAGMRFDAIAIDGPIAAPADGLLTARACELILSRGAFSRRCKPGLSHFGFGLPLRAAAMLIASEMEARAKLAEPQQRRAVIEAFPNAFLGVLMSDEDYEALGPIKRGSKSDAYYAHLAATQRFDAIFDILDWRDAALRTTLYDIASTPTRTAHEHRAALVCLLTAACALSGSAEYVGDETGGFICLPPKELWTKWARDALPSAPDLC